jgi:hypothetical protein
MRVGAGRRGQKGAFLRDTDAPGPPTFASFCTLRVPCLPACSMRVMGVFHGIADAPMSEEQGVIRAEGPQISQILQKTFAY